MERKESVVIGEDSYGIRKLSWKSLDRARRARTLARAEQVKALGGDVLKALRSEALEDAAEKLAEERDKGPEAEATAKAKERYDSYDQEEILLAGVETRNGAPMKPQHIKDDIDKAAAEILHNAIVDLSDPAPEALEAAEGKS